MLWGGGHANYVGNEMYVWDGDTGEWGRGSLPSRTTDSEAMLSAARHPVRAHLRQQYLSSRQRHVPYVRRELPLGAAAFSRRRGRGHVSRAGPYLWDPAKADPNKVGGTAGFGLEYVPIQPENGNMWIDRHGHWTGTEAPGYINGTTAYRTENGKDVVYLTADATASGFPSLYRYTLGDVRNGGQDHMGADRRVSPTIRPDIRARPRSILITTFTSKPPLSPDPILPI